MPASSISSVLSWGAYLVASAALVMMLAPPINGVAAYSHKAEASLTLDGVTSVLDGLRPGLTATLSFVPSQPGDVLRLGAHLIGYESKGFELLRPSRWLLPNMTLVPGAKYQVWLANDALEVGQDG